jgi:hypothetical protein
MTQTINGCTCLVVAKAEMNISQEILKEQAGLAEPTRQTGG